MTVEKFEKAKEIYERIESLKDLKEQTEDERGFSLIDGDPFGDYKMVYYEKGTKEHAEMKQKIESDLASALKEFEAL